MSNQRLTLSVPQTPWTKTNASNEHPHMSPSPRQGMWANFWARIKVGLVIREDQEDKHGVFYIYTYYCFACSFWLILGTHQPQ